MQWGNAKGEPYTGNPYVRFDEGTEVVRPPPTLLYGYDPLLSKEEIKGFGVRALDNLDRKIKMEGVIVAVAHDEFKKMKLGEIKKFMNDAPVLIDVRGTFNEEKAKNKGFYYKTL